MLQFPFEIISSLSIFRKKIQNCIRNYETKENFDIFVEDEMGLFIY